MELMSATLTKCGWNSTSQGRFFTAVCMMQHGTHGFAKYPQTWKKSSAREEKTPCSSRVCRCRSKTSLACGTNEHSTQQHNVWYCIVLYCIVRKRAKTYLLLWMNERFSLVHRTRIDSLTEPRRSWHATTEAKSAKDVAQHANMMISYLFTSSDMR